ncbi:hypothetical protein [Streptomyces sp. NPDC048338]|uniref:hypothetical protein n=1 Tax=Streptomyces sp. NPDC048338 TaxID=3365536 RepID=UPI00370FDB2F
MSTVSPLRWATGGLGLVLIGIGVWRIAAQPAPAEVLVWLAGAVVLHDAILAPLVLALGLLLVGSRDRGLLRGASIVAGSVLLVTLPLLLRPGAPPNPSALPLPYGRNLVIVLAAVAVTAGGLLLERRRRARRRERVGTDD